MFKKSLLIFGLLLCCNGAYAGSCDYFYSHYLQDSYKDEFISVFDNRSALICSENNNYFITDCDLGEIIYMKTTDGYYIGNGRGRDKKESQQNTFHKCIKKGKINGKDDYMWDSITVGDLPACGDDVINLQKIEKIQNQEKYLYGINKGGGDYYVHVCVSEQEKNVSNKVATFVNETIECESGKYYIDTFIKDPTYLYQCVDGNKLSKTAYSISLCFDIKEANPLRSAPEDFDSYGEIPSYRAYLNMDKVTRAVGDDYVYKYVEDPAVMCQWCNSGDGWFATLNKDGNLDCRKNEDMAWCLYAMNRNRANVEWDDDKLECKCVGADADKKWNKTKHKCKSESDENEEEKNCDDYVGQEAALACCKLEKQNQAEMIFESDKMTFQTCECKNNKEWDNKNNQCIDPECLSYAEGSDAKKCCMKGSNVAVWNKTKGKCFCQTEAYEWDGNDCKIDNAVKTELDNARKTINDFFDKADEKASGWKDATGKVNTKRIASDVTAGVVLGTVGGVISGMVIKKKQVEKGFEVLHCAVGGQSVANWGDTFSVGLRR